MTLLRAWQLKEGEINILCLAHVLGPDIAEFVVNEATLHCRMTISEGWGQGKGEY